MRTNWQGPVNEVLADCGHDDCHRGQMETIARGYEPEWSLCAVEEAQEDARAEMSAHAQESAYGLVRTRDGGW